MCRRHSPDVKFRRHRTQYSAKKREPKKTRMGKPCSSLPVQDTPVDDFENDNLLSAGLQEVQQFALQGSFGLMLGDCLQVLPRCFAPALQLNQTFCQLIKINLRKELEALLMTQEYDHTRTAVQQEISTGLPHHRTEGRRVRETSPWLSV